MAFSKLIAVFLKGWGKKWAGCRTLVERRARFESAFNAFLQCPLPRKSSSCKAQSAAALVARRAFATQQMLLLRGSGHCKKALGTL